MTAAPGQAPPPVTLEDFLRERRAAGRPLLVPYVMAGVTADWTEIIRRYADAGADAIEVGFPFSDPMLDGPTIQEASGRALAAGTTVPRVLAGLAELEVSVPLVAMTYGNLVEQTGAADFCAALSAAGARGLIVPDIPLDEAAELEGAAARAAVDLIHLAAPSTPTPRLREIAARSRGFVYAVTHMGTTGERQDIAGTAARLAGDIRRVTDRPVLLGFGISTPEQAATLVRHADGVVIASALTRRQLDGSEPRALGDYLTRIRQAVDQARSADAVTARPAAAIDAG